MVKENSVRLLGSMLAVVIIGFGYDVSVSAERFTSPSYTIDASVVGNSFGGAASSTSYTLTSSGGESIIGQGSGGSYKLDAGYVSQLTESSSSFSLAVQPSGLTGYYSFDNVTAGQTSIANDAGFNARTLTSFDTTLGVTTGKVGSAAVFNGTSTRLNDQAGSNSSYMVSPNTALTVEGWIKTSATGRRTILWNNWDCIGWEVNHYFTNKIQARIISGTNCGSMSSEIAVYSSGTINNNTWQHFAAVFDRELGELTLYVNGQQSAKTTGVDTSRVTTANNPLRIGAIYNNTELFSGAMDEIKIFNRRLSGEEVKAEYDAQNIGSPSGLSLGTIVPNSPNTALFDSIVQTDATSYSLAIHQNADLTNPGGATISAISPTIASPQAWVDGTTKGLGFTLTSTNATAIDGKWNGGAAYASLPTASATTIYSRSGTQTAKDVLTARLRADVTAAQALGQYNNVVTVTGTFSP